MVTPTQILTLLFVLGLTHATSGQTTPPAPEKQDYPASAAPMDTLENQLMGTWVLAKATTPGNPSGIGIRQKIFSPGRWEIIQRNPETGEIVFHHGGSYRLNGDVLEQKVEFATQKTKNYIGQVRRFRITVKDDTHVQIGIGNPFNEVWIRPDAA